MHHPLFYKELYKVRRCPIVHLGQGLNRVFKLLRHSDCNILCFLLFHDIGLHRSAKLCKLKNVAQSTTFLLTSKIMQCNVWTKVVQSTTLINQF